jgi:SAM-dependent methyltransferase
MEGYLPSTYGDRMAAVYDDLQGDREAVNAVEFLVPLASGRPVLELGVGTGRVAIPLSARGIRVHGIDASPAMLDQLRSKPGAEKVVLTLGDFAKLDDVKRYSVIFVLFGTIFCLTSQEAQVDCFRAAARALVDDGVFVVEASVPDFSGFTRNQNVRLADLSLDRVTATFTQHDRAAQTTSGQNIMITESGIRLMPVHVRYAWPSELDLMAQLAGLQLRERWQDWTRTPFVGESQRHVSVFAKRTGG